MKYSFCILFTILNFSLRGQSKDDNTLKDTIIVKLYHVAYGFDNGHVLRLDPEYIMAEQRFFRRNKRLEDSIVTLKVLSFVASIEREGKIVYEESFPDDKFSDAFKAKKKDMILYDVLRIKSITTQNITTGKVFERQNPFKLLLK